MKKETAYDILIVGQGLAGSVLALQCFFEGKSVLLVNDDDLTNSSKVAAGIWNPVVFKRLTKSWMADELLPALNKFYHKAEHLLGEQLITPIEILKILPTENEISFWRQKSLTDMSAYLSSEITDLPHQIANHFSAPDSKCAVVKESGYLNIPKFLALTRAFFQEKESYASEKFAYDLLKFESNKIIYKNASASCIVFCEGVANKNNPWFNTLPFKPAKGEVLTLSIQNHQIKNIINKNIFVLPIDDSTIKIGSNYDWNDLSESPTEKGKNEIESKFNTLFSSSYSITKHAAGVRPASIDRRPIIGCHDKEKKVNIFNGFGTKGVMLAPYFADKFFNCIFNNGELLPEVNVNRFYKKENAGSK